MCAFAAVWLSIGVPISAEAKITISGQIEAEQVRIGVPFPLRVTSVNVAEGDHVSAGQVLLTLDDSEFKAKSQAAQMALSALTTERDRLRKSIAQLQSKVSGGANSNQLQVSGQLHKGAAKTRSPKVVPEAGNAAAAGKPTTSSLLSATLFGSQTQALDMELQEQTNELNKAETEQQQMLAASAKATSDAAAKAYGAQKTALQEVEKAKLESANKHGLFSFLVPSKLKNAKAQAIREVVKAKEDALDQGYAQQQEGMKRVLASQQQAMQESFAAKRQALELVYKARKSAVEQVAASMNAMQQAASDQQKQIQAQLSSFQSSMAGMSSSMAGAAQSGGGIASALAASQSGVLELQLESARTRLLAVESSIATARGAQLEIQAKAKSLKVVSPISGICATRNIQVGEMPIPGQTLITILNPNKVYLRAYVPENMLGGVKVGQKAWVKIDYKQAPTFDATVTSIDQQAQFTPENVSLPEDRVRQVFGVRLLLKSNAGDYAKPGMPADAYLEVN